MHPTVLIALVPPLLFAVNGVIVFASACGFLGPSQIESFLVLAFIWFLVASFGSIHIFQSLKKERIAAIAWILFWTIAESP